MRALLLVTLLLCFSTNVKAKKLLVSVYYESLCPDCIRFMTTQMTPSFGYIADYVTLDLVPFGKATADNSTGHWRFACQHGPEECFRNKVHSCVIDINQNMAPDVHFINCTMSTASKSNRSIEFCAGESGISLDSIKDCLQSGKADELLARNGIRTEYVIPRISFVPTIIFNSVYDDHLQEEALKRFLHVVCDLLENKPHICTFPTVIRI